MAGAAGCLLLSRWEVVLSVMLEGLLCKRCQQRGLQGARLSTPPPSLGGPSLPQVCGARGPAVEALPQSTPFRGTLGKSVTQHCQWLIMNRTVQYVSFLSHKNKGP